MQIGGAYPVLFGAVAPFGPPLGKLALTEAMLGSKSVLYYCEGAMTELIIFVAFGRLLPPTK